MKMPLAGASIWPPPATVSAATQPLTATHLREEYGSVQILATYTQPTSLLTTKLALVTGVWKSLLAPCAKESTRGAITFTLPFLTPPTLSSQTQTCLTYGRIYKRSRLLINPPEKTNYRFHSIRDG